MKNSLFISYSHENKEHIKRVQELQEALEISGVNTTSDFDREDINGKYRSWIDWMFDHIQNSSCILIVISKKYKDAFEGKISPEERDKAKSKGVTYETALINSDLYHNYLISDRYYCVYFSEEDKIHTPIVLQERDNKFLIKDNDITDLLKCLPEEVSKKGKHNLEYINRRREEKMLINLLKSTLEPNKNTPPGIIVQVNGPPLIGKSKLIEHCISNHLCDNSDLDIDILKVTTGQSSQQKSSSNCINKITELICSKGADPEISSKVAESLSINNKHLIIYLGGLDNNPSDFSSLSRALDVYNCIRLELSDFFYSAKAGVSLIIESRSELTPHHFSFENDIHSIRVNALHRNDVESVLDSYIKRRGLHKNPDFGMITNAVWHITRAVPGMLSYVISKLESSTENLKYLYKLKSFDSTSEFDFPVIFRNATSEFVEKELLSTGALNKNGDTFSEADKKRFIKAVCSLKEGTRTGVIINECFRKSASEFDISVENIKVISKEIFFITPTLPISPDPYCNMDQSIQKLLFSYYFQTRKEVIDIHQNNLTLFRNELIRMIDGENADLYPQTEWVLPLLDGFLWHQIEIYRINSLSIENSIVKLSAEINRFLNEVKDEGMRNSLKSSAYNFYYTNTSDIRNTIKSIAIDSGETNNSVYLDYPQNFFASR